MRSRLRPRRQRVHTHIFKTFCLDAGVPKPMVDFWMGYRNQTDMDFFYYDPVKSGEWMHEAPFREGEVRTMIAHD